MIVTTASVNDTPVARLLRQAANPRHPKDLALEDAEWKRIYERRVAVERVFSRLKERRTFNKGSRNCVRKVCVMVEKIDPVYQYIDEQIQKLRGDWLFGEERNHLYQAIYYTLRLLIDYRVRLIRDQIHTQLQTIRFSTLSSALKTQVRNLDSRVKAHISWGLGALQETDQPIEIYNQLLNRLKSESELGEFGCQFQESHELPPLPPAVLAVMKSREL